MNNKQNRAVFLLTIDTDGSDLKQVLEQYHWQVNQSDSLIAATDKLAQGHFNVAIAKLSDKVELSQLEQLEELLAFDPYVNWLLILPDTPFSGHKVSDTVHTMIAEYCFDFHHGPVQAELLLTVLGHAYGMADVNRDPRTINGTAYSQFGIIGNSEPMQQLYRNIQKVCELDDPVLITGETGTGKELVANAIHYHSPRADAQIIVINCGSLADSLVQAELFGYEKGAFTGAYHRKVGRIEASNGGTLFLDEIGDLPLSQQANLLRFLQEKTIVRVGGHEEIPVDVRIMAATHIDLKQAVAEGHFRDDLYYRLRVLHITIPPLRERGDDIELLCRYFLQRDNVGRHNRARGLSAAALRVVNEYDWKGNVRELANTIKHAQIMSDKRLITPEDLELERRQHSRQTGTLEQLREDADRSAIQGCLRQYKNNVSQAAHVLGVSRVTLHRLINKYHLHVK